MSGFLQQVVSEAHARVAASAAVEPLEGLRWRACSLPGPPKLTAALMVERVAVIAEIKRASPSRGRMAEISDPAALAQAYQAGGATAVSVLTEPAHFLGSLDDLAAVARAVSVPVLRKDFLVDPYQVWEAAAAGAAAVLLIVAALDDASLAALLGVAEEADLDVLVEAHDVGEVTRAASAHAHAATGRRLVLGVNARDLATLSVDRGRFAALVAAAPPGALLVAESGVRGPQDVARHLAEGAHAVLVGEHVATAPDPAAAVAALVGAHAGALR